MGAVESQFDVKTENVVASSTIGQELDLEAVAADLDGAEFDMENFPGLVHQIDDPDAAVLIFRSGKIITTGASSVGAAHEAMDQAFDRFGEMGIAVSEADDVQVQNIVCSADLGEPLNLNAIAIGLGLEHVEYEPEQFPGLVYRLPDEDTVVLLFGSGKVIVTGATNVDLVNRTVELVVEELEGLGLLDRSTA